MQHFVGLDVDRPVAAAGIEGALGLDGEHPSSLPRFPRPLDDAQAWFAEPAQQIERTVLGGTDVDDDFVAEWQDGQKGFPDGEVEADCVGDQAEPDDAHPRPYSSPVTVCSSSCIRCM